MSEFREGARVVIKHHFQGVVDRDGDVELMHPNGETKAKSLDDLVKKIAGHIALFDDEPAE